MWGWRWTWRKSDVYTAECAVLWLKRVGCWAQETPALHGAPIGPWAPLFSFLFYRMRGVYKHPLSFLPAPAFCDQFSGSGYLYSAVGKEEVWKF